MKTNINKFQALYGMQLHKAEKICALFDEHLYHGYAKDVIELAAKAGIKTNSQSVRNVRNGFGVANLPLFNIIIELAKEKEAEYLIAKEKFKNLTTTI